MTEQRPTTAALDHGIRLEVLDDDAIWRVVLATPKSNILDLTKVHRLEAIFEAAREANHLKAVLIEGEGEHFSFGASVQEHLPGRYETMIPSFHRLFHRMLDACVVTLAAVRGQCLGGALELTSFCNRVFAAPDARLGQPEIALGVFPPVASVALAERVGRARAEDMCLSGRSLEADEALRIGLVDEVADDPTETALDYARSYLLPRSASSLRLALRAVRGAFAARVITELRDVEELYIEDLMATNDAKEGLQAFLDKRQPVWSDA